METLLLPYLHSENDGNLAFFVLTHSENDIKLDFLEKTCFFIKKDDTEIDIVLISIDLPVTY